MRARVVAGAVVGALAASALAGCTETDDVPASFLAGLRVLAIVATPPEVAPGASASVTVNAVDTTAAAGAAPSVSWSRCTLAPLQGQAINPDCDTLAGALVPLGDGATITVTMLDPTAAGSGVGAPDSTGGVYLPLFARLTSGGQELTASYRLRVGQAGAPANANPTVDAVVVMNADGTTAVLDEAVPLPVSAGQHLSLGVTVPAGAAETFTVDRGAGPEMVTETLVTSWFSTAGELDHQRTSAAQPFTELNLERRLPATPARIDVYAVTRDERGGTDLQHRVLELR